MFGITQFKKILNDDELSDIETVKSYLAFSFKQRKAKKDYKLYINICKIFNIYPETIKELLDNIPTLGYYKDYFYVLMFSRNEELDNHIYDIVINQINSDLQNLKDKKEISTIGKWLPRENCKINKQCNFIDKFNVRFYPDINDKFTARRRYRKLKTMLNEQLGTLEAKMCTKQYDSIDFQKVTHMALKRNTSALMKHDECKIKLDEYEIKTLKKMSLSGFTKELINGTYSIDKMINLWEHNRFRMEIPYIDKLIPNAICIMDLSKDTFTNGGDNFTFGIALLIDQFSILDKKIIICNDNVMTLRGNIQDKVKQMIKYVGPCKPIDIEKYYEMAIGANKNNPCKTIIFVTNKQIENIEFLSDKGISFLQFIPENNSYDIVFYNGDKIRKFRKYEHSNYNENASIESKKDIKSIITTSSELNDMKSPIYIIFAVFTMWFLLKLYGLFI